MYWFFVHSFSKFPQITVQINWYREIVCLIWTYCIAYWNVKHTKGLKIRFYILRGSYLIIYIVDKSYKTIKGVFTINKSCFYENNVTITEQHGTKYYTGDK